MAANHNAKGKRPEVPSNHSSQPTEVTKHYGGDFNKNAKAHGSKSNVTADARFTLDSGLFQKEEEGRQDSPHQQQSEELVDLLSSEGPIEKALQGDAEQRAKRKVLSEEKLKRIKEAHKRRGIIYVSRIPPHMKPQKIKELLSQYGEVGRVYCAPEDPALRKLRKKKGGNTGKNFTEGWVEFEDKRVAKRIAAMLNNQQIGGKKRSAYFYDLWCLKYLPGFKWDHLTEEINYQRAVREQKLVAEISAAKRERDFYLSRVDKAKAVEAIKERKQKKLQETTKADTTGKQEAGLGNHGTAVASPSDKAQRQFGQRRAKPDPVLDANAPELSKDILMMLARKKQRTG